MRKEILFRLNAGKKNGMGHLSRNLALAEVFSANNLQCRFLIQTDDKDKVLSFLQSRNRTSIQAIFISEELNCDKDISKTIEHYESGKSFLILDHYDHDLHYQKKLKRAGIQWAQFDYKKEDQIIADIVINPNVGVTDSDYDDLIDSKTKLCVGERFAIISNVFKKTKVNPKPDRILIAMGGGNYPQEVVEMITALVSDKNYRFDLITTQNLFYKKLKEYSNVEIHKNPENIAGIYARNHVAVVAGGVTTYELAYLDIPMIIIPYTINQQENAKKWQELKYAIRFKSAPDFYSKLSIFEEILVKLKEVYLKKDNIIDGLGSQRIFKSIIKKMD